jgi:hypothetical protein
MPKVRFNRGQAIMMSETEFMRYISAFNSGDCTKYRAYYSPSIKFRNGAGAELKGPDAIVSYYEALKGRISRQIEVRAVVTGETALCAALHSCFDIVASRERFAGELLGSGDKVLLDSIALYELEDNRFIRIGAKSIRRQIIRLGDAE